MRGCGICAGNNGRNGKARCAQYRLLGGSGKFFSYESIEKMGRQERTAFPRFFGEKGYFLLARWVFRLKNGAHVRSRKIVPFFSFFSPEDQADSHLSPLRKTPFLPALELRLSGDGKIYSALPQTRRPHHRPNDSGGA